MSKMLLSLVLALVLLGFLISTTFNLVGDLLALKTENRALSSDLARLRSDYNSVVQERDALALQYADLLARSNALEAAYSAENQARVQAEADAAIYKGMMVDMIAGSTSTPVEPGSPAVKHAALFGVIDLADFAGFGANLLAALAIVKIAGKIKTHRQRQRRSVTVLNVPGVFEQY